MVFVLLYLLIFFVLFIGSIGDIKKREVLDYLSYFFLFSALGLRLIYSFFYSDVSLFLYGLFGFLFYYILAILMFYTGQWGGGDSKILLGLGAALGLGDGLLFRHYNYLDSFFNLGIFRSLVFLFLLILFVGAIYAFLWVIVLSIIHFKKVFLKVKDLLSYDFFYLKYLFLFVFLINLLIFILNLFLHFGFWIYFVFILSFILISTLLMFVFLKSVEAVVMIKKIDIDNLVEGDWIIDDVYFLKKKFLSKNHVINKKDLSEIKKLYDLRKVKIKRTFSVGFFVKKKMIFEFINKLKMNDVLLEDLRIDDFLVKENTLLSDHLVRKIKIQLSKNNLLDVKILRKVKNKSVKLVVSPKDLKLGDKLLEDFYFVDVIVKNNKAGIELWQIDALKELKKKKIKKKVLVKEGIPFLPSFLIAFIIALFL